MSLYGCRFLGGGPRFDLPSIRHLYYYPSEGPFRSIDTQLLDTVSTTLVSLTCGLDISQLLPRSFTSTPSIAFCHDAEAFEDDPDSTDLVDTKHLRLCWPMLDDKDIQEGLVRNVKQVELWTEVVDAVTRLETLILCHNKVNIIYPPPLERAIKDLLDVCQRRGIRVIWEERAHLFNFSDSVCSLFIRLAEDRRAALLAEGTS